VDAGADLADRVRAVAGEQQSQSAAHAETHHADALGARTIDERVDGAAHVAARFVQA